jgi:hypothetical protein
MPRDTPLPRFSVTLNENRQFVYSPDLQWRVIECFTGVVEIINCGRGDSFVGWWNWRCCSIVQLKRADGFISVLRGVGVQVVVGVRVGWFAASRLFYGEWSQDFRGLERSLQVRPVQLK